MNVLKLYTEHKTFIVLLAGFVLGIAMYMVNPFAIEDKASRVVALALIMILWWVTDVLPMPVVSLIPIAFFPLLGISTIEEAAKPYANPIIFLFLGGFMLGLAIEKWNLHQRIALNIIHLTGTSGNRIVLGFILATGLLSMWLSNTATTMMMYPIALSVIHVIGNQSLEEKQIKTFSLTIMLSIAYASNIGGVATIIGTPPNVAYVGYFYKHYHTEIDFTSWMLLCMPLALLLLIILYWVLVRWFYPNHIKANEDTRAFVKTQMDGLGHMTTAEKRVLVIFIATAFMWIFRSHINEVQDWVKLDDTIIAILCTLSLFIMETGNKEKGQNLLEWHDTSKMSWGILLLFGGGLSLANALENAGLIASMGHWLSHFSHNIFLLVVLITILSIFLSEIMSNVAQVVVFAPVVSSMADALHINPLLLGIPMTLSASLAGMLPMGTPPNAIVFASGRIKFFEMVKVGFVMNIVAITLVILFSWFILPSIFP